jgi:hypothetical protein
MNDSEEYNRKGLVTKIVEKHQSRREAYQITKISENKATFVLYRMGLYQDIGDSDKVVLNTETQIGESMTLKVDKPCMDKIINNFGNIVAMVDHVEGIVTDITTFEEL